MGLSSFYDTFTGPIFTFIHFKTFTELVKKLKEIYPKQYKAREKAEEASGVFDLPLPPTPPKLVNPFSLSEDENAFGSSGGIVMQMPTGQFVVMPLTPTTGIDLKFFVMNEICLKKSLMIEDA